MLYNSRMIFSWKIAGEAGFGITTMGAAFARICGRHGLRSLGYAEYPSLIRGGFTTYEITLAEKQIDTLKDSLDMLVCLRQDGFDRDSHRLTSESIVLYDADKVQVTGEGIHIPLPFKEIRAKHTAHQVMVNTISMGATMAVLEWDLGTFIHLLEEEFGEKGEEIVNHNKTLAQEGWDAVRTILEQNKTFSDKVDQSLSRYPFVSAHQRSKETMSYMIMTGNDAFALGSVVADCRGYFAYPMSPASTVLSTLASWGKTTGMVVRHVEDEIAAISEALGASYAGVRSSVGTSGGGFALMVESLSYAGVAEIPLVVFLAQRPGPATGLPTWTGQGDLLFAVHAGHGEFPKIVLSPGDTEEMVQLTAKAYNLADIYQIPVIVLTEKMMTESHHTVSLDIIENLKKDYEIRRGKIVGHTDQNPYLRYKDSVDGISECLIPGRDGNTAYWQANSYEHLENTHTTEDAQETIKQVQKRARKVDTYLNSTDYELPQVYGDLNSASTIFVSYGSNKGPICYAQELLEQKNVHTAYIHFTHLYPLHESKIRSMFEYKGGYVLIENSSTGQLGSLLRQECNISIQKSLLRYDGRPILAHDIVEFVTDLKVE